MDTLSLIIDALWFQGRKGIAIVDGNEPFAGTNLWGLMYRVHDTNPELAEQVRRAFLGKSPEDAIAAVRALRDQKRAAKTNKPIGLG